MRLPCSYGEAAKYENVLFPRERDENKHVKMGCCQINLLCGELKGCAVRSLYYPLSETGHFSSASAQNGDSRLETTELSRVLGFDHERDKKPTPVRATLLLTHHDVL